MVQACHAPGSWGQWELAAPDSMRDPHFTQGGERPRKAPNPGLHHCDRWGHRTEPPSLAPKH